MIQIPVRVPLCSLRPFLWLVEKECLLASQLDTVTREYMDEESPRLAFLQLRAQLFVASLAFVVIATMNFYYIVYLDVVFPLEPSFGFVAIFPSIRNIRIGLGEQYSKVIFMKLLFHIGHLAFISQLIQEDGRIQASCADYSRAVVTFPECRPNMIVIHVVAR